MYVYKHGIYHSVGMVSKVYGIQNGEYVTISTSEYTKFQKDNTSLNTVDKRGGGTYVYGVETGVIFLELCILRGRNGNVFTHSKIVLISALLAKLQFKADFDDFGLIFNRFRDFEVKGRK
jgi:hypothetical protein